MQAYDILILGGGAAGLAAAVAACRTGLSVAICEKGPRVGKKLLSTGSGTCNLSNLDLSPSHYHSLAGRGASFVAPVLSRFDTPWVTDFFRSIGVEVEPDRRGRLYPLCRSAGAVLDCLRLSYLSEGVDEITDCNVVDLCWEEDVYRVTASDGRSYAGRKLLVALGGAASPGLGGTPSAFHLLSPFRVKGTDQYPSVTALKTDTRYTRAVKGLRVNARVTLRLDGKELASCTDELLFTDNGLSGPAVLQISRDVGLWETAKGGRMVASIHFLPQTDIYSLLLERRQLDRPADDLLTGLFHKRIGQTILRASETATSGRRVGDLTDRELEQIAKTIAAFDVDVLGTTGMRDAQVTVGGLHLDQVDPLTMELKKCPGLYVAGEMLDLDGDCGGYNLHFAFASGVLAAQSAAEQLLARHRG